MNIKNLVSFVLLTFLVSGIVYAQPVWALPSSPFTTFDPSFTQEVYGAADTFLGGVAFAPNGDVLVDHCAFSGSSLERFIKASTFVIHGTTIHTDTVVSSNAGCGMTNHPDGFVYSNTASGVVKLDPNTGTEASINGNPLGGLGPAGNALGITVDPVSHDLFYVSSSSNIIRMNPSTGVFSTFAVVGGFVDGLFWNSDGTFLYASQRSSSPIGAWEITPGGTINQKIPIGHEPDGIAFHVASGDVFVDTTDGFIIRINLHNHLSSPTVSDFASGGFRGDLSQVGSDGCLYVTQEGTRYDDGTVTGENSVVRICGGFSAPPGVSHGNPVGGTIVPIDMTALFITGAMTNAFWMLPTLGGIAGAAIALFKVKRKSV